MSPVSPCAPAPETNRATHNAATDSKATGRAANGRFAPGNRGGTGNPFARRVAALRKAFISTVTPEDLRRICQRLVTQAILGDVPSIKVLLSYALGRIPLAVNPDTLDQAECRMFMNNLTVQELGEAAGQRVPAAVSLAAFKGMEVVHVENARRTLLGGAPAPAESETSTSVARPERSDERNRTQSRTSPRSGSAAQHEATKAPSPNGTNGSGVAGSGPIHRGKIGPHECGHHEPTDLLHENGQPAPSPNGDNGSLPASAGQFMK